MKFKIGVSQKKIEKQVKQTVHSGNPIILKANLLPYTEQVLTMFLKEIQQEHINEYVSFFVAELVFNAQWANLKRIYFREEGLDINNSKDYLKGMRDFKEKAAKNIEYYAKIQGKKESFFELHISKEKEAIGIEVLNNALIVPGEEEKIREMIQIGEENDNVESVLTAWAVSGDDKRMGLGMIIIILMMKKMGMDKEERNISVEKRDGNTIIGIKIPIKPKIESWV